MRDNGVEDFPDPDAKGAFDMGGAVGNDPQLQQAQETCTAQNPLPSAPAQGQP